MLSGLRSGRSKNTEDKIFICYRRSDASGFAGRLADTLKDYFGEDRVFRDIEGISPGEDFHDRIEVSLKGAGALIVLIGPNWLVSNEAGKPRLYDPDDSVATEIGVALEKNLFIVPALVDGATMPRAEDLPEGLKELTKRNAVTLNDEGWKLDVSRLAKVLSFEVAGSVTEQKLARLKLGMTCLLFVPWLFTLLMFVSVEKATFNQWGTMPNGIAIVVAAVLLASTASWIDEGRRRFIWAAVIFGLGGAAIAFVVYFFVEGPNGDEVESDIAFTSTSIIITAMLALLGLSGYKPNERVQ